jgi:diguanylate cyclase (GGDEF)-like protein/PAS domain S-box-containing protein
MDGNMRMKILRELAFKDGVNFGDINLLKLNEITTTYRLLGLIDSNSKIDFNSFIYKSSSDLNFYKKSPDKSEIDYFKFFNNFYFKLFLFILILIIGISLYFRLKMEKLLKKKTTQLELQNKIFDENICSSKTDLDGYITDVSEAFCKLTGYTKEELISKKLSMLRDKSTPIELYKDLWLTISSGHIWRGEIKNRKKDGSEYYVNAIISPVFDEHKNIIAHESIIQDITLKKVLQEFNTKLESEVEKQTKELKLLAVTDKLTGLYNRVKLDDELASSYEYYKKFKENFSIVMLDIDHFKAVNDTYGHQVGDTVLREMAMLIKDSIRSTDIIGRWGGEEFMLICPKTDSSNAYAVAQNIRENIQTHNFPRVGSLTISAGVSDIISNEDVNALVNSADSLLYDAKHNGRNVVKR